ncbi:IS30 family transposase, partial [Limosilactobacillus fermentum]
MTYSHLTTAEHTTIANFFTQGTKAYKVAQMLKRSVETIYRLKNGATIVDYQQQYVSNRKRCGRKLAQLPQDEVVYINELVAQGWTPDTIIGRGDRSISCNRRTLYR